MTDEKSILCVGLCVLDFVHVCDKYPEEDSDKRSVRGHWQRGGNASNNCTVLRNLGAKCEFLGVLSNSNAFRFLTEDYNNRSITTKNCPKVQQDPIFSSIVLSQETKSRTIICTNQNFPILKYNDFRKIDLEEYKWIHFEARNPQETTFMIDDIVQYNNSTHGSIRTSLELEKPRETDLVLTKHIDYIFFCKDFALYFGWEDLKAAVYGLRERIQNKDCCLICTWGNKGASILEPTNKYTHIKPHPPEEIVDTLGAGDTFCAAVIFALASNKDIKDAVEFGSKVVGYKLSFNGYDNIKNFTEISQHKI